MGVTIERGVLIIDDPRIEQLAHQVAEEWGVSVEDAVLMALEDRWAAHAERQED